MQFYSLSFCSFFFVFPLEKMLDSAKSSSETKIIKKKIKMNTGVVTETTCIEARYVWR